MRFFGFEWGFERGKQTLANAGVIPETGSVENQALAKAAAAENAQVTPFEEKGVVGTPITGGFVVDLGEYRPDLYGRTAIPVYEQMRRGDAQVAATLKAMKLPMRSGTPSVMPASDSAIDKEIAQMVEDNLLGELEWTSPSGQVTSQSWDDVLENALLMLDFGCSAYEEVYAVDGDHIRLRKLASRPPITLYRFITEPDGETLATLQQYGYRGNNFEVVDIPAWKLCLFVNEQEGANFYGRSILRPAYKHWYYKEQLYSIDAIGCERNAVGVPVLKHLPGSTGSLSTQDRELAQKFVSNVAANQSSGMYVPPGLEFDVVAVKGQVRNCFDSIRHHNEQISKTCLAMFLDLGQSGTGNRALGASQQDFFFLAAQALYNAIAWRMSKTTVRRLVSYNYDGIGTSGKSKSLRTGPAKRPSGYPRLVAPSVKYVSLEQVVEALSKLAVATVDVVHPDENLENYVRKAMNVPDANKPRPRFAPITTRAQLNDPNAINDQKQIDNGGGAAGKAVKMSEAGPGGLELLRAPQGPERWLALSEIVTSLDQGKAKVASILRAAKPAVIAEALHKAMAAPVGRAHQVSVPADAKLVDHIVAALREVRADGARHVHNERARQLAGGAPVNPRTGMVVAADDSDQKLKLFAQAAVSEFNNNLTQRAVNKALDVKKNPGDATRGEAIVAAQQDLEDGKDGWIDNVAGDATNEAFGAGRSDGFAALGDDIKGYLYSAILDVNTCEACSAADGQQGPTELDVPPAPNPNCDGGDLCRCVIVAIFEGEA